MPIAGDLVALNPQPIPPGRYAPGDPSPWREAATLALLGAALRAVGRRQGPAAAPVTKLGQDLVDILCPPPRPNPDDPTPVDPFGPPPPRNPGDPPPPPSYFAGLAAELMFSAARLPDAALRDAVLDAAAQAAANLRPSRGG